MKVLKGIGFPVIVLLLATGVGLQSVHAQDQSKKKQEKPRIAVLPFANTNEQARTIGYGEAVSGMLVTSLINGAVFRIVERSEIERIMKEQAFQLSGAVNAETAKRIGELYAVDFLVFGTVAKLGNLIETDMRLVDTETGEAMLAESAHAESEIAVRGMAQELVRKIENRYQIKIQPTPVVVNPTTPAPPTSARPIPAPPKRGSTDGMALIPAGQFTMGNNEPAAPWNEKPARTVYVDAFYLDMTEVTNQQYQQFIDATGHAKPRYWSDSRFNKPDMPVVGVTWEDAMQYAAWIGKRLPSEAEWEYAARGGLNGAKFPWGNEEAKERAWFGKPYSYGASTKVAAFATNGYGLFDMAGNVAEWCADWFRDDAYRDSVLNNPTGPATGTGQKVVRGGAWYEDSYYLRCSARKGMASATYSNTVGFRCAMPAR